MTAEPNPSFDTESRDVTFVEFEVQLDTWRRMTPEEAREFRRHLPPPWNNPTEPPAPKSPAE